jgi:hypothetical protein
MITTLVWVVIVAAVAGLALWAIDQLGAGDPIRRVARVVIVVVAVLIIIGLVAALFGVDTGMPRIGT